MTERRRVYQWKSFWLGLFVLVFFGWAWWWSVKNFRTYSYSPMVNEHVSVNVGVQAFGMVKMRATPVSYAGGSALGDDVVWQPEWAFLSRDRTNAGVLWVAVFPMWFPLVCHGVLFAGWMVWRMKMKSAEHRTPNDE